MDTLRVYLILHDFPKSRNDMTSFFENRSKPYLGGPYEVSTRTGRMRRPKDRGSRDGVGVGIRYSEQKERIGQIGKLLNGEQARKNVVMMGTAFWRGGHHEVRFYVNGEHCLYANNEDIQDIGRHLRRTEAQGQTTPLS